MSGVPAPRGVEHGGQPARFFCSQQVWRQQSPGLHVLGGLRRKSTSFCHLSPFGTQDAKVQMLKVAQSMVTATRAVADECGGKNALFWASCEDLT